jgi:hypothetical protein
LPCLSRRPFDLSDGKNAATTATAVPQGTVATPRFANQANLRRKIEDCPVDLDRFGMVNDLPGKRLQPWVMPNICQFARTEASLQDPSHIYVQKRLGFSVTKQHDRACDVLANTRESFDFSAARRENAAALRHLGPE